MADRFRFAWFYAIYGLCFLQTPIFRGEEENTLEDVKNLILSLLKSERLILTIFGIGIAIGLYIMYNHKRTIQELEMQVIDSDTWFATREDNGRVGIVVSVSLRNKSTSGIRIKNCKLSGYSPKDYPAEILLEGTESEQNQPLIFPQHKHFARGQDFYLGPSSSENLWFYYESRSMTMSNVLEAPLSIKDARKKKKSLRVRIPRHAQQIAIYQEMAKIW